MSELQNQRPQAPIVEPLEQSVPASQSSTAVMTSSPRTAQVAIMFADISGSTQLYENLGDVTGRHTVCECLNVMSHIIHKNRGVVVKTIGDEIMCTFPTALDAAKAGCEMNRQLGTDPTGQTVEAQPLSIRVGLHFGSAILEGRDVHGNAVITAARMVALAKPEQILLTEETVKMLSGDMRLNTRLIDHSTVKGKEEALDIYELNWAQDITDMDINLNEQQETDTAVLRVSYRDEELLVTEKQPTIVLGRSAKCEISVDVNLASRQHVKLEWRRGKFFISDNSTNGTYIYAEDGTETFIRREQILISGKGQLSLGSPFLTEDMEMVSFSTEESH